MTGSFVFFLQSKDAFYTPYFPEYVSQLLNIEFYFLVLH